MINTLGNRAVHGQRAIPAGDALVAVRGRGVMDVSLLYESPFVDVTPRGPDSLFSPTEFDALVGVLDQIRSTALAA